MGNTTSKINIALLYGGQSSEHDFNMATCGRIISALTTDKYNIKPVKILKNGLWICPEGFFEKQREDVSTEFVDQWLLKKYKPDDVTKALQVFRKDNIDVVYLGFSGEFCEDGSMQGLFEILNLPYIGSGVTASCLNFDKEYFYQIMSYHGLSVAPFVAINKKDWFINRLQIVENINEYIQFPLIVKPADRGLSIGTFFVPNISVFYEAVEKGFKTTNKILVQKYLDGYEVNCAILDTPEEAYALPPIAIKLTSSKIFDLAAKINHKFIEEIPPQLRPEIIQEIKKVALRVFKITGCQGFSRIELMIVGNTIYVQENNTLPGMGSSLSLFPKAAKLDGIEYGSLIDRLIHNALAMKKIVSP